MHTSRHSAPWALLRAASALSVPLLFLSAAVLAPAASAQEEPGFDERLEVLVERLEKERVDGHIPGMAIAVVRGDELVLARGFGVADLASGEPVTPATRFFIGSSTKAFTTTLVAMLAEDGTLGWDDPVTDHLPWFELPIDAEEEEEATVLLRDLACHRTGFTRMGAIWGSGALQPREILQVATGAKPIAGFRERFLYNNVQYLAVGYAAGEASGSDWHALMRKRILDPLGMEHTGTRTPEDDPSLAEGYAWIEELEEYQQERLMKVDPVAPAGSIVSTVEDMAQWLRLQINRGSFDGSRLIGEDALRETWTAQTEMGPGLSYGLGWMLHEGEDRFVVEHGGNTFGYSSMVAFAPEEELGFVLLMNLSTAPLQNPSRSIVFDTLLEELPGEDEAALHERYAGYLGEYVADFGPFDEETFTVQIANGRLAVDVPSQMLYELKEPNEEGRFPFAISGQIQVAFEVEEEGVFQVLRMYQGPMAFEIPRKGHEPEGEIPLDALRPFVGAYEAEEAEEAGRVEVLITNDRLAVDIPGELAYELHPPDADGRRVFRVLPAASVAFHEEDGHVTSFTFRRGEQEMEFLRIDEDQVERLPTAGEVLALRGADLDERLQALGTYAVRGTIRIESSAVEGDLFFVVGEPGYLRTEMDLGRHGWFTTVITPERGQVFSNVQPERPILGEGLKAAHLGHPRVIFGDWREHFDRIEVVRADEADGRAVYVVRLEHEEAPETLAWVDAENGDILRLDMGVPIPGVGIIRNVVRYSDYEEIEGVRLPAREVTRNDQAGEVVSIATEYQPRLEDPERHFRLDR